MAMKIMVIMPAYNAGQKIESVYDVMDKKVMGLINQFVIINDGSKDDTLAKAEQIKLKYGKITICIHEQNKGYGAAQKTGFDAVRKLGGDIAIILHSDGQTDSKLIPELIQPILDDKADMVLGSRMIGVNAFNTQMPMYKFIGNKVLTWLENRAYNSNISEFHTGYIAYRVKALQKIPYRHLDDRFHFDGHMIIMALIAKLRIAEVKVPIIYDDEKSHLSALGYGMDVLKTIRRFKKGEFHKLMQERE